MTHVTVCICTFRRTSVIETLRSLSHQTGLERSALRVLIVDNDDTDVQADWIKSEARLANLNFEYIHAPARNISIARNAALDRAETRWIAFIDDDELATSSWLHTLLETRHGHQAVIGDSIAVYPNYLPSWLRKCDFHSNRIKARLDNAYTSNALLDNEFIRKNKLRFRIDLGQTGGEDTFFFRELSNAGGSIRHCPEAIVLEPVRDERATMRWVLRRKFREGQTHAYLLEVHDPKSFRVLFLTAGAKCVISFLAALASLPGTPKSRQWLARGTLHAGALSFIIKPRILREYNSTELR